MTKRKHPQGRRERRLATNRFRDHPHTNETKKAKEFKGKKKYLEEFYKEQESFDELQEWTSD